MDIGEVITSAQIPAPNIRHDWYQSLTHVVLTILVKDAKKDDLFVDLKEREVKINLTSHDYLLHLHLSHEIIPNECQTKILSSKIELKLKKLEGYQWNKLEGEPQSLKIIPPDPTETSNSRPQYPSSNKHPRDWDKIVSDIKEAEKTEEPEGDEALNNLFQKIYADGSDETRKAMNKSFSESGGTVLSTNWNEIGPKNTDIKPPDGMEYKKWDQ